MGSVYHLVPTHYRHQTIFPSKHLPSMPPSRPSRPSRPAEHQSYVVISSDDEDHSNEQTNDIIEISDSEDAPLFLEDIQPPRRIITPDMSREESHTMLRRWIDAENRLNRGAPPPPHIRREPPGSNRYRVMNPTLSSMYEGWASWDYFQSWQTSMHELSQLARADDDLERALRESVEDSYKNYGSKKIDQPEAPTKTTEGFSRDVAEKQVLVCAVCRVELGAGIEEEKTESSQGGGTDMDSIASTSSLGKRSRDEDIETPVPHRPFSRFSDISEVEKILSKRVFFTPCGHLYCGLCVQNIKRKRGGKASKSTTNEHELANIPDFTGRYIDTPFSLIKSCIVPGCGHILPRSRAKFFKEMFI